MKYQRVPIGEIAEFINGKAFKPEEWESHGLPIIRIQNLTGSTNIINYYSGGFDPKYLVVNGDILISWSASLGVFIWNGENAILNQHIFKVNLHKGINKQYFYYAATSILDDMVNKVHGSTMQHITKEPFESTLIPLPPLEEQERIAGILQKADRIRRLRRFSRQLSDTVLQSVFLEMFGDLNSHEKVLFGDVVKMDRHAATENECKTLPYIGLEHIEKDSGRLCQDYQLIPMNMLATNYHFSSAHVLYGKLRPYLNKVFLPEWEGVCTTEILPLLPKANKLNRYYLWTYMMTPAFVDWASNNVAGANLPRIAPEKLADYPFPLPALELQDQFANIVIRSKYLQKYQTESTRQAEQLFQALLAGAFGAG